MDGTEEEDADEQREGRPWKNRSVPRNVERTRVHSRTNDTRACARLLHWSRFRERSRNGAGNPRFRSARDATTKPEGNSLDYCPSTRHLHHRVRFYETPSTWLRMPEHVATRARSSRVWKRRRTGGSAGRREFLFIRRIYTYHLGNFGSL